MNGRAPSPRASVVRQRMPGVLVAAAAALLAWGVHTVVPAIPLLTASVAIGIVVAQVPAAREAIGGVLSPGLTFSSRTLMRLGIVLLGLKLSLVDIAALGWVTIVGVVVLVAATFVVTYWFGRLMRLPGQEPLLIATGFSICGASAIGAMAGVTRAKESEQATPVALVTLCGTLAIAVLPILWHPLGLTAVQFGHWVGASVHDVGQVVATAQIAGASALAVAIVVKLTRVLLLAPTVAVVGAMQRRADARGVAILGGEVAPTTRDDSSRSPSVARPPIVPLFVAGFIVSVVVRTLLPLPEVVLATADTVQTALLAVALFALGTAVRIRSLVTRGWRALVVALGSWLLIAVLALAAVALSSQFPA